MNMKKELIVYAPPGDDRKQQAEAAAALIAAETTGLQVRICREDDLSVVTGTPAVGIEVEGLPEQIATLETRLRNAGCRLEDGGRQVSALDEEGGQ